VNVWGVSWGASWANSFGIIIHASPNIRLYVVPQYLQNDSIYASVLQQKLNRLNSIPRTFTTVGQIQYKLVRAQVTSRSVVIAAQLLQTRTALLNLQVAKTKIVTTNRSKVLQAAPILNRQIVLNLLKQSSTVLVSSTPNRKTTIR
jgi:hypothetical protein